MLSVGLLAGGRSNSASTKYYWSGDIEYMAHKLETYKQAVKLRERNAKSTLKAFIKERISVVEDIVSVSLHATSPSCSNTELRPGT